MAYTFTVTITTAEQVDLQSAIMPRGQMIPAKGETSPAVEAQAEQFMALFSVMPIGPSVRILELIHERYW